MKRRDEDENSEFDLLRDFDVTGRDTVPEKPSKASAWIVSLGTVAAFGVLAVPPLISNPDFLPKAFHMVADNPQKAARLVIRATSGISGLIIK